MSEMGEKRIAEIIKVIKETQQVEPALIAEALSILLDSTRGAIDAIRFIMGKGDPRND